MKVMQMAESQPYYLSWEVQKAAMKLVKDIMLVKEGENVLITCESASDERVVNATAGAIMELGAYPVVLKIPQRHGDKREPVAPVAAALKACDVWIHYDFQLFQSKAWQAAMEAGVRQITAAEMDVSMLLSVIGRVDADLTMKLGNRLVELTNAAKTLRITAPGGTDFSCSIDGRMCRQSGGKAKAGTSVMLLGQDSFNGIEDTIEGVMVFDGALYPPQIGLMQNPVKLVIEKGVCTKIEGNNRETFLFDKWMSHFNDPSMYRVAHISYGFNPGITEPRGRIAEDERIFGCITIGLGKQVSTILGGPHWDAPGHTDGIILSPTIYLDGVAIEKDGYYCEPSLVAICKEMGLPDYI